MTEDMIPVGLDDILEFECSADVPCFNDCCRDLNQILTPYDILRLKNRLCLTSADFLRTYTSLHHGPGSGLPIITFKPDPSTGHACPFVSPDGCTVYEDRPGSCRLYPLARAVARSRETGRLTEYYALIEEPHCRGAESGRKIRIRDWIDSQEVTVYNRMNDRMMEIISLKNRIRPGQLDGAEADRFTMACYDLDRFRRAVFEEELLAGEAVPESLLKAARDDDEALLELGLLWIRQTLFGIPMDNPGEQGHED